MKQRFSHGLLRSSGNRAEHTPVSNEEIPLGELATAPNEDALTECRICKDTEGTLFAPCACQGSMALVHDSCLAKWISAQRDQTEEVGSDRDPMSCEVCLEHYSVEMRSEIECTRAKIFSPESMTQYASCVMALLLLVLLVLMLLHSCGQAETVGAHSVSSFDDDLAVTSNLCAASGHWGVVLLGVLMVLLVGSTIFRAFERWKGHNEHITLMPTPP